MSKSQTKPFFENLDALRFFAFLTVFISHAVLFLGYESSSQTFLWFKKYILTSGDLGVSFFFVLSGFLITFLLLTEKESCIGQDSAHRSDLCGINIKGFYIRRILRIWPVYFVVVILGFFIIPYFLGHRTMDLPFGIPTRISDFKYYALFLANFRMASIGATSLILAVLWSISVEEQFYLIWPWIIGKTKQKNILYVFLFIIAISFYFRFHNAYYYDQLKYATLSVASDLVVGATLAYLFMYSKKFKNWIIKLPRWKINALYIKTILFIIFRGYISTILLDMQNPNWYALYMSSEPFIFSILFALIIAEQNWSENSFYKARNFKIFSYLGRRSYGLYSYHMIGFLIFTIIATFFGVVLPYSSPFIFIISVLSAFILTVSLAELSYKYMEKKILKMKDRV